MAYSNLKLDKILEQVKNAFGKQFMRSMALSANVSKEIIPRGQNSLKLTIPAALTASKRVAGGAAATPATPAPTASILYANTEYSSPIRIDRLDATGTEYDISAFQATNAADAIIGSLNTDVWAKAAAVTTNAVGAPGTVPSIKILNKAWTKLFNAKVPSKSALYGIVGGDEWQVWKDAMTVSDYGMLGSGVVTKGQMNEAYGFYLEPDQQRPGTSGTDAVNIAFHPEAFKIGFRQDIPEVSGIQLSQVVEPITGITLFATKEGYSDSNGIGDIVTFFVVAGVETVYDPWACIING